MPDNKTTTTTSKPAAKDTPKATAAPPKAAQAAPKASAAPPTAPKAAPETTATPPKAPTAAPKATATPPKAPTAAAAKVKPTISAHARHHMVEVAAYYLAQARGFQGNPNRDWFEAEHQIDAQLRQG